MLSLRASEAAAEIAFITVRVLRPARQPCLPRHMAQFATCVPTAMCYFALVCCGRSSSLVLRVDSTPGNTDQTPRMPCFTVEQFGLLPHRPRREACYNAQAARK